MNRNRLQGGTDYKETRNCTSEASTGKRAGTVDPT